MTAVDPRLRKMLEHRQARRHIRMPIRRTLSVEKSLLTITIVEGFRVSSPLIARYLGQSEEQRSRTLHHGPLPTQLEHDR